MATLGQAQIADRGSCFDSGAAFLLSKKSSIDQVIQVSPDQEIEVRKGSPYVVARIAGAGGADEAFDISHEVIQKGLDILSIKGREQLLTRGVFDDSLLWWRNLSGQVLRITSVSPLSGGVSIGPGIVQMKDGKVVPPTPSPTPMYHESLRYFRLSQTAEDVFEAFRNLYLAFEGLLELIANRKPRERENDWLERALVELDKTVPLDKAFHSTTGNARKEIFQEIYKDLRCAIFHSKTGPRLLPKRLSAREKVIKGHAKLTKLFLAMVDKILHYQFSYGMLTAAAHDHAIRPIFEDSTILISSSRAPFADKETPTSPAYRGAIEVKCEYRADLSEPGLIFWVGAAGRADLARKKRIGRVAIKKSDTILIATTMESDLTPRGIDVLEVQLGSRLHNRSMPKYFFDT